MVEGYWFSGAYKSRRWDGKQHLLRQRATGVTFPSGLLDDVQTVLDEHEWPAKIEDNRARVESIKYEWNGDIVLRNYQEDAVGRWAKFGFGILKMPIRSGKTKTAARIIHDTQQPTIFIVPSKQLLYQTAESLGECFPKEEIGMVGDGNKKWGRITVVIVASLVSMRKRKDATYKKIVKRIGLVVFDECHHLTADAWCDVMMDFEARYRLGLSATPLLDKTKAAKRGVIWLKAACGPIREDVNMSQLIRQKWIVQPTFHLYPIKVDERHAKRKWSQGLIDDVIFLNESRNHWIARLAKRWAERGKRVLIVTRRVDQAKIIAGKLTKCNTMLGEDSILERARVFRDFVNRKVPIVIGTVFKEGVDVPEIDVVINAEGGFDEKATIQRLRNLTPCEGKTEAIVIDFMDLTNRYFAKHSRERLKAYRSEPAFIVEVKELG
jgi:superfamily II DNA or RNA helicase